MTLNEQSSPGSDVNAKCTNLSIDPPVDEPEPSSSKVDTNKSSNVSEPSSTSLHRDDDEMRYSVSQTRRYKKANLPIEPNAEMNRRKREIETRLQVNERACVIKQAVRAESARLKKLKSSRKRLAVQLTLSEPMLGPDQLILDYDRKRETFIRVHPALTSRMKPYQRDAVKFMYDCCYGDVSSVPESPGSGCILTHCLGVDAKMLVMIAFISTVVGYPGLETKRIIVVSPKNARMNWDQEVDQWLEQVGGDVNLKVFQMTDSSDTQVKMRFLKSFYNVSPNNAHCLLITYATFRAIVFHDARKRASSSSSKRTSAFQMHGERILLNPGADLIILDEGHLIKNCKTQIYLALADVATKRRIILTGSPMQNSLDEYFCMANFVKPAFLGSRKNFNTQYVKQIRDGQHKDSSSSQIRTMKTTSFVLHKQLENFVRRMELSVGVGQHSPQKLEYVLYVPMTPLQETLYEQYLKICSIRLPVMQIKVLEDYNRLREIWTHPMVLAQAKKRSEDPATKQRGCSFEGSSEGGSTNEMDNFSSKPDQWWRQFIGADELESLYSSNKILLLFEILQLCQDRGEKCLVFSGFVTVLDMVQHFMKMIDEQHSNPTAERIGLCRFRGPWRSGIDFYRMDGHTGLQKRCEMNEKFNDPNNRVTRVCLTSTLQTTNLVGANRVVLLDTSWNRAEVQQCMFRIFCSEQRKPCYIYRFLAMHTMEEKVYSQTVTKQAMMYRVVDKKQVDRNYRMADLEQLYRFERVDMETRPNAAPAQDDLLNDLLQNNPELIYRYHIHETMLDNKTETDLSDSEKEVVWTEFTKSNIDLVGPNGSPPSTSSAEPIGLDSDSESESVFRIGFRDDSHDASNQPGDNDSVEDTSHDSSRSFDQTSTISFDSSDIYDAVSSDPFMLDETETRSQMEISTLEFCTQPAVAVSKAGCTTPSPPPSYEHFAVDLIDYSAAATSTIVPKSSNVSVRRTPGRRMMTRSMKRKQRLERSRSPQQQRKSMIFY